MNRAEPLAAGVREMEKADTHFEIVKDQSRGRTLLNWLGAGSSGVEDEVKLIPVKPGDRIILCSDGITGDTPDQFLSGLTLFAAFVKKTPEETAQFLRYKSKKDDDKSVIVLDIAA
jgi:serine/threonine protein phosphatase PrpC